MMTADTRAVVDGSPVNPQPVGIDPPPVPPDTLPYDPESGVVTVSVPYTADTTLQDVPANVLYQMEALQNVLAPGFDAADAAVGEWIDRVGGPIDAAIGELAGIINLVAGSVLSSADASARDLDRVVDGAIRAVGKRLSGIGDEIRAAGVDVPYDPGVWSMMVDTPPQEWLPYLVPEIGAAVGLDLPGSPVKLGDPGAQVCSTDPVTGEFACVGDGGGGPIRDPILPPPPPLGPPPPPVPPPWLPPPPFPPPPVPPPPPPPPGDGTCPAPVCCDPAPINITVPPPTVIMPPPTSPPPPYPGSTCPDPPDVVVSPNIKVDVQLPPPPGDDAAAPGPGPPGAPKAPPGDPVLDWSSPLGCSDIDRIISAINPAQNPGVVANFGGAPDYAPMFSAVAETYVNGLGDVIDSVMKGFKGVMDGLMAAPMMLLNTAEQLTSDVLKSIGGASVPNPAAAGIYGAKLAAAGWAEKQSTFPLTYLMQAEQYAFNYANPQFLPSQSQIDGMWLLGKIDEMTWTCWTRAHGNLPDAHRQYRDAQVGKPTLNELGQLRLRGALTRDEYYAKAAQLGWQVPSNTELVFQLTTQLPTQSDLLRMMVRDAADDAVALKYDYDKDFDEKFTGQIKAWSEAQGVPAEIFKYSWRSHWVIPSNTQLYEMFHRLRPDRAEVLEWDRLDSLSAPGVHEALFGPRPPVVSIEDVQTALEVNDQAPFWVDKQIAISYHPITRTDATRAYSIGAFSEQQLYSSMLDNGYAPADARTLTDFYVSQTVRSNSNATGVLTLRKISQLYKQGALTRAEALDALKPIMVDPVMRTDLIDRIDLELRADFRLITIKGIRKRLIAGAIDPLQAVLDLGPVVPDAVQVQRLVDTWVMEKMGRLREVTAMTLCKWYNHRVINAVEYLSRIEALGYTHNDALHIAQVCDTDMRQRLAAAAAKAAEKAAAAVEKETKRRQKVAEQQCHPKKPCWDGTPAPIATV